MFSPIVSVIEFAWAPVDAELFLAFAISEPVESHVHGFGPFGLDLSVDDAFGGGVVCLERGGRLCVSEFLQDNADEDCLAGHDVKRRQFRFGGRGHDMFDDVGNVKDGPVVGWDFCVRREKEMSPCTAARYGFAEITGIAVDGEDHVTGIVGEHCFILGGYVVQELFCLLECFDSWFGGLRSDGADRTQKCGIYSPAEEEEFSTDLLDEFLALWVEECGC